MRHHVTYELALGNGSVLRTRISRPVDKTRYGHALWSVILNKQLCVSEDEFWACVRQRTLPTRSRQITYDDEQMLPAWLVSQLLNTVGVPEAEIRDMTVEQAKQRLNHFWSSQTSREDTGR